MTAPQSPIKVDGNAVAAQLQPLLLDLVALALNGKQAHWHVHGRQFLSVHERLDDLVTDVRAHTDRIAERIVTLDVAADGRPHTVAEATPVFPEGFLADDKVLSLIIEHLDTTIDHAREALGPLDGIDLASQDLVLEALQMLEKHRWMFAASAR
ncbi:MAG: Dps family protein [Actinomycetota bacterium]